MAAKLKICMRCALSDADHLYKRKEEICEWPQRIGFCLDVLCVASRMYSIHFVTIFEFVLIYSWFVVACMQNVCNKTPRILHMKCRILHVFMQNTGDFTG